MDHLVKINVKKRYIRITIPEKVVKEVNLREYPYARIRVVGEKTIEVEGVALEKRNQG